MNVESDESIPREGLMADARRAGHEEEFFNINMGVDPKGRLTDVADSFLFVFVFLSNG